MKKTFHIETNGISRGTFTAEDEVSAVDCYMSDELPMKGDPRDCVDMKLTEIRIAAHATMEMNDDGNWEVHVNITAGDGFTVGGESVYDAHGAMGLRHYVGEALRLAFGNAIDSTWPLGQAPEYAFNNAALMRNLSLMLMNIDGIEAHTKNIKNLSPDAVVLLAEWFVAA